MSTVFTTWTLKLEILKPLKCLCIFALPNETATVVQWISHSPCGHRFDPGLLKKTSTKINLPVEPSGAAGTTSKYWSRQEKKNNKKKRNLRGAVVKSLARRFDPGLLQTQQQKSTSRLSLPVPPVQQTHKNNLLYYWSRPGKKPLYHAFIIILMLNVNHDFCLNDPVSCSALLSRIMTRRLHCSTSNC